MKTEQIMLALAVAREKSISKAARAMYIFQPTASNLLKSLEKEVGYRIFTRERDAVLPTGEGRVFLEHALNIEKELSTISQANQTIRQIDFTVLSYHLDFAATAFEELCDSYHSDGHTGEMKLQYVSHMDNAAKMVAKGSADVAVVMCMIKLYDSFRRKLEKDKLEVEYICELPVELTCRKGHPILSEGHIRYDLLKKYPGFSGVSRTSLAPYISLYDSRFVGQARTTYIMEPSEMRYRLLKKTDGFLISVPEKEETKEAYGLESLPHEGGEATVFAVYRRHSPKEEMIREYVEECRRVVDARD